MRILFALLVAVIFVGHVQMVSAVPKGFFDFTPPRDEPEAKAAWRLMPEAPRQIAGPVPVILLHGSGGSRWEEFVDWAANSSEAAAFRARFQVWNYLHPMKGVNAAVGFSPEYPGFDESIVAYLDRFIRQASDGGVEVEGTVYTFPPGPFAMLAHSHGGLVARAFLVNYPEHAGRCGAVVALSAPLTGTPWATPQWMRHTLSRLSFARTAEANLFFARVIGDLFLRGYISTDRQSDLDMGWGNFDAQGGFGIPTVSFRTWPIPRFDALTLSPRDANLTEARTTPGIADSSFEPRQLPATYCGGLDYIIPETRAALVPERFFLYGGYLTGEESELSLYLRASWGLQPANDNFFENMGLRVAAKLMGCVASAGSDMPLGTYALSDGFVPLQSQLMLDGRQCAVLYETSEVEGKSIPVSPYQPREDLFRAHTLANPLHIRVLRDWSHLDTVTGRYNKDTGHSPLFPQVASDLLSAFEEDPVK